MNKEQILQLLKQCQLWSINLIKKINQHKHLRNAALIVICCIALSSVVILMSGAEVYSLTIAGKNVGYVTDKSLVDSAIKDVQTEYTTGKNGSTVSLDENSILCKRTNL